MNVKLAAPHTVAWVVAASLSACAPRFHHRPDPQARPLSTSEAKNLIQSRAGQIYEVRSGRYSEPRIEYPSEEVAISYPGKAPGASDLTCKIDLTTEGQFTAIDAGNSPYVANSTLMRYTVSDDDSNRLCRVLGWAEKEPSVDFADALAALRRGVRSETVAPAITPGAIGAAASAESTAVDADFAKIAAEYRSKDPKPTLPERAHRDRVLAEHALKQERWQDAQKHYARALEKAPWWPEGRQQLAQLLGKQGDFAGALREMRRYLALGPGPTDARKAQDQIYVWEDELSRKR